MWSYIIVRTRNGEPLLTVDPVNMGSWARRLSYKGTGRHEFLLSENPNLWAHAYAHPASRTLVVCWDGTPVYAGIIWSIKYRRATGVATVTHEDLWSIWEKRLAIPQDQAYQNPDRTVIETRRVYNQWDLRTHAGRAITLGSRGPMPNLNQYQLPIVVPEDREGNWNILHWTYDFNTVADVIDRLSEMGPGPAFDFFPVWDSNGRLQWQLRALYEPSNALTIHLTAADSPVRDLTVERNFTNYLTEVHVTGDGSEMDTLYSRRWIGPTGDPDVVALVGHESLSDIKTQNRLDSHAQGLFTQYQNATEQTECSVVIGESGVSLTDIEIGRTVTLISYDDPVISNGMHAFFMIGFKPAGPDSVTLELAPVQVPANGEA